jgi:predicted HD superfamily hydrolase involved in NAD metabolism
VGAVSYETALAALRDRLSARAIEHSVRVAETACALATTYGADAEAARLAGLLHDWDRELGDEQLLAAADAAGIELTETDRAVPYLLHARTGARSVGEALPELEPEVLRAIESHTVGAGEMSDLDKVVYVADMIAPGRDFPGVEEVRELAGSGTLHALYLRCYQLTLHHLVQRQRPLHPRTVAAWNALVGGDAR